MRRWNVVPVVLLAVAVGCGKKAAEGGEAAPTTEAAPPSDTTTAGPAAGAQTPAPPVPMQPAPTPRQAAAAVRMPTTDEPWTPTQTGTVNPGMTRDSVIAVWGPPVAERTLGAWTYLYFRNGCEASCGTFDVVFLENGQVVNAIVRGPGHTYGGTSTSPAGSTPHPTRPGGTEGSQG